MKDYGRVRGSKEQAKPLIIGKDTVYVHTDIVDVEDDQCEYNEVQYDKDEFIKLMAESNGEMEVKISTQESVINELMFEIIPTMSGGGV